MLYDMSRRPDAGQSRSTSWRLRDIHATNEVASTNTLCDMCAPLLCTVNRAFLECRIIQPEWADTFGRRDARALPGAPCCTGRTSAAPQSPQLLARVTADISDGKLGHQYCLHRLILEPQTPAWCSVVIHTLSSAVDSCPSVESCRFFNRPALHSSRSRAKHPASLYVHR
jgi:hypothetical protein